MLLPLLGLQSGVTHRLQLRALVVSYSGNHKVVYDTVLALALLTKINVFVTPFGVAVRGKAFLKIGCIVYFVLMEPQ